MSNWIPVEERLPEEDGNYLVYGNCTNDGLMIDIADFWQGEFFKANKPTHWKALPEPPKNT